LFEVTLQAEKLTFYTKTANSLQPYALRYECHSTKPGDENKIYVRTSYWMGEVRV